MQTHKRYRLRLDGPKGRALLRFWDFFLWLSTKVGDVDWECGCGGCSCMKTNQSSDSSQKNVFREIFFYAPRVFSLQASHHPTTALPSQAYKKSIELWYQSDERKRRNRNCRSYLCTERAWMLLSRADAVENRKTIENRSNCFEPRTAFGRSFCALERFLFPAKSVRAQLFWESSRVQRAHGKNSS